MYGYKVKSLIDMRSLADLLSQIDNIEFIISPGWKSHILASSQTLPTFFPCKILCKYKGEYQFHFRTYT